MCAGDHIVLLLLLPLFAEQNVEIPCYQINNLITNQAMESRYFQRIKNQPISVGSLELIKTRK